MKRIPAGRTVSILMKSTIELQSRVDVLSGLRNRCGDILKQQGAGRRVLVVSQEGVPDQWTEQVIESAREQGFQARLHLLPAGEQCKSAEQLLSLWAALQQESFERSDTVLAVGGGAVSDIAGFAAATYLRGVRFMCLPTTLLAQVDAAIGGKTAINLESGKNLAGAIHMPEAVLIDVDTLSTLPARQFLSGMGEIFKYAFIEKTIAEQSEYKEGARSLLQVLESACSAGIASDDPSVAPIIQTCIRMKLAVVAADPLEKHLRRCLNLGHTLGHAIEKASQYAITHGEAVSIGTVFALHLAQERNRITSNYFERSRRALSNAGLPTTLPDKLLPESLVEYMMQDKKREGGTIKFVLPYGEGRVDLNANLSQTELRAALERFGQQK